MEVNPDAAQMPGSCQSHYPYDKRNRMALYFGIMKQAAANQLFIHFADAG
jgi:hypothetical protein